MASNLYAWKISMTSATLEAKQDLLDDTKVLPPTEIQQMMIDKLSPTSSCLLMIPSIIFDAASLHPNPPTSAE